MNYQSIFNLDRLVVYCACGGGSNGRSSGTQETPVLIRFLGSGSASRPYQANGRRYVFGNNPSHKVVRVFEADITNLFEANPELFERV